MSSQPSNSARNSEEDTPSEPHQRHSEHSEEPQRVTHTDHPPIYSEQLQQPQIPDGHDPHDTDTQHAEVLAPPDLSTFSPIPSKLSFIMSPCIPKINAGVSTPKGLSLPPFSPFNPLAQPPPIRDQLGGHGVHGTPPTSPRDVRRAARQLPTLARGSADLPPLPLSADAGPPGQQNGDISESEDIDSEESTEDEDGEDEHVNDYSQRPNTQRAPTTDYFSLTPTSNVQTPRPTAPLSPGLNGASQHKSSSVLPPKLNQRTASSVSVQQRSRQNTQSTVDGGARTSEESVRDHSRSPEALRRLTSSIMLTAVDPHAQASAPSTQISIPNRTTSHKDVTQLNKSDALDTQKLSVASPRVYARHMSRSLTDLSAIQPPSTDDMGVGLHPSTSAGPELAGKGKEKAEPPAIEQLVESSSSTREIGVGTSPPVTPAAVQSAQMEQERRNWKDVIQNTPLSPPPPLTPLSAHGTPSAAKRRMSLPNMMVAPPQYDEVALRETIFGGIRRLIIPREEEGREHLPSYRCGIHIEGLMPRKMEFTSPGNQARDRTWRRVYVVLHGTVLKVYKADKWDHERAMLSSEIHDLKEADHDSAYVHQPPPADAPIPPVPALPQILAQRPSFQNHINAPPNNVRYSPTLLRTYSLQNAESGLAADYIKRRNVIRVRLLSDKGVKEQFLIQAYDQSSVIDWIEVSAYTLLISYY